jgi:peptidoglycan biosynthesis protein MviN/MurJ (putative lipid II flippase)
MCYRVGMANSATDTKTPVLIAVVMVIAGVAIAAAQHLAYGSIVGGIIAAAGAIPACYGMWKGIQQETQATLAMSVGAVILSLVIGGLLIVLAVVHGVHELVK